MIAIMTAPDWRAWYMCTYIVIDVVENSALRDVFHKRFKYRQSTPIS